MRVDLKGIHRVRKRLASGAEVEYHYAWRGRGPQLKGQPGSPEYIQSYAAAHASRKAPRGDLVQSIIVGYRKSKSYANLSPRTRADYDKHLARIEVALGSLPIEALEDPRITRDFTEWRDLQSGGARQQDYAWMVLMRLLSWGRGQGMTIYRPPERMERLYHADRSDKIWDEQTIAAFMAVAPEPLQRGLVIALESGQRQGDLLVLPWSAYDGQFIRLRQSKAGRRVTVPVTRRLKAVLDSTPRTCPVILTNSRGHAWRPNAFRKAWGAAAHKAGIVDRTFHDLRGTAVTRLSEADCTPQQIAQITGHSLREAAAILDRYCARSEKLAIAAIAKLERVKQ